MKQSQNPFVVNTLPIHAGVLKLRGPVLALGALEVEFRKDEETVGDLDVEERDLVEDLVEQKLELVLMLISGPRIWLKLELEPQLNWQVLRLNWQVLKFKHWMVEQRKDRLLRVKLLLQTELLLLQTELLLLRTGSLQLQAKLPQTKMLYCVLQTELLTVLLQMELLPVLLQTE